MILKREVFLFARVNDVKVAVRLNKIAISLIFYYLSSNFLIFTLYIFALKTTILFLLVSLLASLIFTYKVWARDKDALSISSIYNAGLTKVSCYGNLREFCKAMGNQLSSSRMNISPLEGGDALLMVDSQRYFDIHHAHSDVFEEINKREFKLNAASMAAMVYMLDQAK